MAPPRRAVWTESSRFSSPRVEWASVEQTIWTPASIASLTCSSLRSSLLGSPLTSSATPVSSAVSIVRSRSRAFSGPMADQPSGRVAEAADGRVAHRLGHAFGQLGAWRRAGRRGARAAPIRARPGCRQGGRGCRRHGCRIRRRAGSETERAARLRRRSRRPVAAARRDPGRERPSRSACDRRSRCSPARAPWLPRPSRGRSLCRPTRWCGRADRRGCHAVSTSAGGLPEKPASRSSGGTKGMPRVRKTASSSGAAGSGPSVST